jgi:hypothetical protein
MKTQQVMAAVLVFGATMWTEHLANAHKLERVAPTSTIQSTSLENGFG